MKNYLLYFKFTTFNFLRVDASPATNDSLTKVANCPHFPGYKKCRFLPSVIPNEYLSYRKLFNIWRYFDCLYATISPRRYIQFSTIRLCKFQGYEIKEVSMEFWRYNTSMSLLDNFLLLFPMEEYFGICNYLSFKQIQKFLGQKIYEILLTFRLFYIHYDYTIKP